MTAQDLRKKILAMAADATESAPKDVVITLKASEYSFTEPLVLSAKEDKNLANISLTIQGEKGKKPIISGNTSISASLFTKVEGKEYYVAQLKKGRNGQYPNFFDFYVNGVKIPMAQNDIMRHPFGFADRQNRQKPENFGGFYVPMKWAEELKGYDLTGLLFNMYIEWEASTMRVSGIDMEDTCEVEGVPYVRMKFYPEYDVLILKTNPCLDLKNREYYLLNSPAFLTEGTYAYIYEKGLLYYYPKAGEDMATSTFAYPKLEYLFQFDGLKNVKIENLAFTGTTFHFMLENGFISGQANNDKRTRQPYVAAIQTYDMQNVEISHCDFVGLGTSAVMMRNSNDTITIHDCSFRNIAMSALSIGNPTTEWADPMNRNYNLKIVNNVFDDIANEYPTAVALYIGMVDGLKILHNSFSNTSYSSISVGWGWSQVPYQFGESVNIRHAEIAFNAFDNYMSRLQDGAAIYVLGANCTADYFPRFNFMHDNFAVRKVATWGARGYYMDGASSNWEVYDNVTSGTLLPLFSQFHVPQQYTHHNYLHDNYSTNKIDNGNHAPDRDTILGTNYVVEEGLEKLFADYPKAKMIYDNAGANKA